MQDKSVVAKSKQVTLKFNQIAINQKYLKKDNNGKSLWDITKEKYIATFKDRIEFGGIYKYLPNEDTIIQNMLVNEYKEPFLFNPVLNNDNMIYSLDEINAMSEKERAGLPLYKMSEDEAAFYLDPSKTKKLPRDDHTRVYIDKKDFDRDMVTIPLAEIVE